MHRFSGPSILTIHVLVVVSVALGACGTLQVGIEPTRTPPPTVALTPTATVTAEGTLLSATATAAPETDAWSTYTSPDFRVSLRHPAHWSPANGEQNRYEGDDGFLILDAIGSPKATIDAVAAGQAGHKLRPYGSQPEIESLSLQGQEARLILPSADASMGGQAMLIVRYPQPVQIAGTAYEFFALYVDQDHIRAIAQSVRFETTDAAGGSTGTAIRGGIPDRCRVNGQELYVDPAGRYCFAYPLSFEAGEFAPGRPGIFGPPLDRSIEPVAAKLEIEVKPAPDGSDLGALTDAFLSEYAGLPVPPIARTPFELGGERAELLEVVPGLEGSRDVLVLHDGMLYRLLFMPSVRDYPQAEPDVEALFEAVTRSFSFLDPGL